MHVGNNVDSNIVLTGKGINVLVAVAVVAAATAAVAPPRHISIEREGHDDTMLFRLVDVIDGFTTFFFASSKNNDDLDLSDDEKNETGCLALAVVGITKAFATKNFVCNNERKR
eukprot:CAMPEP_0178964470 /NCGR_PEP_ID=MMETSP0789-20121207/15693_1 /TAXON_ID=3005 /ORGANISM="Rhizosolenia setigera, Strain CCMP 1694" /LENGTH=113 /DNA_ID=CAMNT_0020649245 /DNA_START=905 /DNA_END=1243 /DNA_ORIENTATION=+